MKAKIATYNTVSVVNLPIALGTVPVSLVDNKNLGAVLQKPRNHTTIAYK